MNTQNTLSITNARKNIFDLAEKVQRPGIRYTLTENGRPKVVMMSADEFESWQETMEIMSDPELMKDIREAEEEYEKGEYITWEEMKKELRATRRPAIVAADKGKKKYTVRKKAK